MEDQEGHSSTLHPRPRSEIGRNPAAAFRVLDQQVFGDETIIPGPGGTDQYTSGPEPDAVDGAKSASGPSGIAGSSLKINGPSGGFAGLTHYDQRGAGSSTYTNTRFSLEPPDQALCVGSGYVLEAVNTALDVYSTSGKRLTSPIALNQFLGLKPEVRRDFVNAAGQSQPLFGDFSSDPKCLYDPATGRFFLTVLQIDMDPLEGTFGPRSHLEVAVSRTSDPTQDWYVYSLDTTDDGLMGSPAHVGCPCFGDQPLIGINADGFYLSTNEFNTALVNGGIGLTDGAQLYELSKSALIAGIGVPVAQINVGDQTPMLWFSVQPASTPPGTAEPSGTEYFLAADDPSNTTRGLRCSPRPTGTSRRPCSPPARCSPA